MRSFSKNSIFQRKEDSSSSDPSLFIFSYTPELSDSTEFETFLICEGLQLNEDDILYHDSDRRPLKIVFPPQPLEEDIIIAGGLNDTAIIDLTIKVYPLPYYSQVIWTIQREDLTEQVSCL